MPEYSIRFRHQRHQTTFEVVIDATTPELAQVRAVAILRERVQGPRGRATLAQWVHASTTEMPARTSV